MPTWKGKGAPETPSLMEIFLAVGGFWGREGHFSLGAWPLAGFRAPPEHAHHVYMVSTNWLVGWGESLLFVISIQGWLFQFPPVTYF